MIGHCIEVELRAISGAEAPVNIDTPGLAAMAAVFDALRGACAAGIGAEHLFVAGVDLGVSLACNAELPKELRQDAVRDSIAVCASDLHAYGFGG
jgi:hypothetical protein